MSDRPDDRKEVVRVAPKVVSLTVHKNTMARRKRHELSRAFVDSAKLLAGEKNLEGFAITVIKDGVAETLTHTGDMDLDLFWAKVSKEVRYYEETSSEEEEDIGDM
ncbi:MAG: hypothetical protein ACXWWG_00620 [Nitrospira sp.]